MKFLKIILITILVALTNGYSQVSWENPPSLETEWILSLAINSNGYIFAGTQNHGLFRSTDNGTTWNSVGSPAMLTQSIWSILINSNDEIYVPTLGGGLNPGVFHSTDNGASWESIGSLHYDKCVAKTNSNQWLYCGTDALGMVRTKDNGQDNWPHINNGMTATSINVLFVDSNEYIFAGTNTNIDSIGSGGIYRSTDYGDHWIQCNSGLSNLKVFALIKSNGFIFAGTEGSGIFQSTNNGDNWVQKKDGLTSQGMYVYSLAINSVGEIFAGTADGIFRSSNNGGYWNQINAGLTNTYCHSFVLNSDEIAFAGTEGGIFRSTSALPVELISFSARVNKNKIKLNWQTATEVNNYGFEIERSEKKADNLDWEKIGFVFGSGNSNSPKDYNYVDVNPISGSDFLYRLKQIDNDGQFEYSDVVEVEVVPNNYSLSQNYPNPFNPNTNIRYSLKDDKQFVSLVVYDILGNEIQTLVNEEKSAGTYELNWSAINFPSGIYFYRLKVGSFVETKKMTLLK